MTYIQLEGANYFRTIAAGVNVIWDDNNFCTVDALVRDGKAAQFRVVPLAVSEPPAHDPLTQEVRELDPAPVGGQWTQQWEVVELTAEEIAANLESSRASSLLEIDREVDAIYGAAIGNRQAEYEAAERQAQAFAQAGHTGVAPSMVASWAAAKGWTAQQAADDILLQAAQWRGAQDAIRGHRLLRKEQVRAAADIAAVNAAMTAWSGFIAAVRQQLGQ